MSVILFIFALSFPTSSHFVISQSSLFRLRSFLISCKDFLGFIVLLVHAVESVSVSADDLSSFVSCSSMLVSADCILISHVRLVPSFLGLSGLVQSLKHIISVDCIPVVSCFNSRSSLMFAH
jgi:hypothetical protein